MISTASLAVMFRFLLLILLLSLLTFDPIYANTECVSVCKCFWKFGKKAAECTDKGLIMIPDGIDSETLILDMSGNNLQILPRETFQKAGLINLQKLYLKQCRLGPIDDNAYRGLTNLVELDLSANLLTSIPSHSFLHVPNLRVINLSQNPIQKIDPFAFRLLPNLTRLDMANCSLQWIEPKAFDGLEVLEYLRLNDNKLANLPGGSTANALHKLRTIELHGNHWKCDCNLRAAKMWIQDNKIHVPVPVYCNGGPDRLKNQSLLDLPADDFAC